MTNEQNEIRRLQEENQKLLADNQALMKKAQAYAVFGDIMRTIALLPFDSNPKTKSFEERIGSALTMHGVDAHSRVGIALRTAFLLSVMPDREKMIRAFHSVAKAREADGFPRTTPGCSCPTCTGVAAVEQLGTEALHRSIEEDYPLTKVMEQRLTDEEAQGMQEQVDSLLRLFEEMGLLVITEVPDAVSTTLDLLREMLAGPAKMVGDIEVGVIDLDALFGKRA
jgi:hypothetical protein